MQKAYKTESCSSPLLLAEIQAEGKFATRFVKLPWEENPEFFTDDLPPTARSLIADLLHRSPEARKPIRTVLHSPLFMGENPTADSSSPDTLKTPAGIFSTHSDWA